MDYRGPSIMGKRTAAGFTLIEVMVVVAIVGILASIALPSYLEHQRKARRAAGAACVSAVAQAMERHYTTALTYTTAPAVATLDDRCEPEVLTFYNIGRNNLAAKTYTITAAPFGRQNGDTCGTLSLNQAGVKTPGTAGCW